MSTILDDDFDREPSPEELEEIEKEASTFDDPDWDADKIVDLDYPGAEYDFDEE